MLLKNSSQFEGFNSKIVFIIDSLGKRPVNRLATGASNDPATQPLQFVRCFFFFFEICVTHMETQSFLANG